MILKQRFVDYLYNIYTSLHRLQEKILLLVQMTMSEEWTLENQSDVSMPFK
jgi:hypothetical protein